MQVQIPELVFDVPDDWVDRSTTSFHLDPTTRLTLSQRPITPPYDLAVGTEALRLELAQLPGFRFVGLYPRVLEGIGATELTVEYRHPEGTVRQTYVLFVHAGALWSLGTTTLAAERAKHALAIHRLFVSLHLKPEGRALHLE
jgi:hypothetical protein